MKYQKFLLKLSGKAFGSDKQIFNFPFMNKIALQLKKLHLQGHQIVIVIGGGNICRAKDFVTKIGNTAQINLDYAGMLSSVVNGLFFSEILKKNHLENVIMSSLPLESQIAAKYDYYKAQEIMKANKILLLVGGAGITHCSTDLIAILKGHELNVDLFLFAKFGIDKIYDKDPQVFNDAKKITKITYSEILQKKLQFIDLQATAFCVEKKIQVPMFVFNIVKENAIVKTIEEKGEYSIVTN